MGVVKATLYFSPSSFSVRSARHRQTPSAVREWIALRSNDHRNDNGRHGDEAGRLTRPNTRVAAVEFPGFSGHVIASAVKARRNSHVHSTEHWECS